MLLLLKNYTLAPAFRFQTSVLNVATRHFLTTSPTHTPALALKTGDKPKRITKKDLTPPFKRPKSSFVVFALERAKEMNATSKTPISYMNTIRESSAAWKKLSEAEKSSYGASPEAFKEYKASLDKWYETLSDEAKTALKIRRRRRKGTGFTLFISETFKEANGTGLGEKIANRSLVWKALSAEKKAEYSKRAAETLYGVRARRAAQRERELNRAAQAKIRAKEKLVKSAQMKKEKEKKEKEKERLRREKEKREREREKKLKKAEIVKEKEREKKLKKAKIVKEKLVSVKGKAGSGKKQITKSKVKAKA